MSMSPLLSELEVGQKAKILKIDGNANEDRVTQRLMEMGIVEGEDIEMMIKAPISHDPVAVRVRGTTIGLRVEEASKIHVGTAESRSE